MPKARNYIFRPSAYRFDSNSDAGQILHRIELGVDEGDTIDRKNLRCFCRSEKHLCVVFNRFRLVGVME